MSLRDSLKNNKNHPITFKTTWTTDVQKTTTTVNSVKVLKIMLILAITTKLEKLKIEIRNTFQEIYLNSIDQEANQPVLKLE
jgi:hypothetical protein